MFRSVRPGGTSGFPASKQTFGSPLFPFRTLVRSVGLSLTTGNVTWRLGSARSKPRAQLGLEDRGGIGSAHYSKMIQEIGHSCWLVMFRFPEIQDVLRGTGLGCKIIDVPANWKRICVFYIITRNSYS